MSQENVEIVQSLLATLNAHDLDGLSRFLHPELDFVDHMGAVGEDYASGIESIRRQAQGWIEAFPDFEAAVEELIDAGDQVVCVTEWRGTGASSGLPYRQAAAEVYTVRAGRIVHAEMGFVDRAEALKAVGLEE